MTEQGSGRPSGHGISSVSRFVPAGIVLLGLVLRLYGLGAQSFWYDEVAQVDISSKGFFGSIIAVAHGAENCPPLSHAFFSLWLKLGNSDYWVRVLPALAGAATVYLMYLLALRLAGRKVALVAAFLLAISPFHLWYSQEARPYVFLMLFSIASMNYFLSAMDTGSLRSRLLHVLCTLAALYLHPYAVFIIAAQAFYVLISYRKLGPALKWRILDLSLPVILYVPWILHMLTLVGRSAGFEKSVGAAGLLYTFYAFSLGLSVGPSIAALHENTSIQAFLPYLGVIVPFVVAYGLLFLRGISSGRFASGRIRLLLLAWILIPIAGAYVVSQHTQVTYNVRYVSVALIPYLLIVALGIVALGKARWQAVALVVLTLCSAYSLRNHYFDPEYWKEDIRGAAAYISSAVRPGDVVVVSDTRVFGRYYSGNAPVIGIGTAESDPDQIRLSQSLENYDAKRLWLLYARGWAFDPDGRLRPELARRYPVLEDRKLTHAEVILYEVGASE